MIRKLKEKLWHIDINESSALLEHISYSVLVFFGWTVLFVVLLYSIPIYLLKEFKRIFDQIFIIVCSPIPLLWLVYRKQLKNAKLFFLISSNLVVLFIYYRWGREGIDSHIEVQYIGLSLLVILLFDGFLPWIIIFTFVVLIISMRVFIVYWLNIHFLTTDLYSELLGLSIVCYSGYATKIAALKVQQYTINQNKQLINQNEKLEELNLFKDKLFNIISHDIRNPIASLKLTLENTDFLTMDKSKPLQLRQMVDETYITIDNLLHWSRLQRKGFKIYSSDSNIVDIVENVLALFNVNISLKDITISKHLETAPFFGDDYLLEIVIRNVIQNAIKFTPAKGFIHITTKLFDSQAQIVIQDSGIGMSPEIIRLHSEGIIVSQLGTSGEQGTGLGLEICHEFIQHMGGKIQIDSMLNKGTTVTIIL